MRISNLVSGKNKNPSQERKFFYSQNRAIRVSKNPEFMLISDLKEDFRKIQRITVESRSLIFLGTWDFLEKWFFEILLCFSAIFSEYILRSEISIEFWILTLQWSTFRKLIFVLSKDFFNFFLQNITKSSIQRLKILV